MALGISLVLGMTSASVLTFSSRNYGSAVYSRSSQTSFVLAEAGLNNAFAALFNPANNPLSPVLLAPGSASYDGGTVTWSGSFDPAEAVWTVTATSTATNPSGTAPARRTLSAKVRVVPAAPRARSNDAWNYVFSQRAGTTCDLMVSARVVVSTPLYSSGSLCLSSGAQVTGGPLVVRHRLMLAALDSAVGSPVAPISEAHIGTGCKYFTNHAHPDLTHPLHLFCSALDNVHASVLDQGAPAIAAPVSNWDGWYAAAAPGPNQACAVASGFPPVFENETVGPARNNSVPTVADLTPPVSYTCRVGPAGAPIGELSWDAPTRLLRVAGTIFIDGSAAVQNGAVNRYEGRGAIYLSGTFLLGGASRLCARVSGSDCDFASGAWDPNADLLVIAANGNGGQVTPGSGIELSSQTQFQGALLATAAVKLGNWARTQGPIVGSTVLFGADTQTYPFPELATVPAGMPGEPVAYPSVEPPFDFHG